MNDAEVQVYRNTLLDDLAWYDAEIRAERNAQRRLEFLRKRQMTLTELMRLSAAGNGPAVEYDELMRLIYETRTELALLKNQVAILMERSSTDTSGLSPHLLTFLAVGGVVTLVVLVFVVSKYLLP